LLPHLAIEAHNGKNAKRRANCDEPRQNGFATRDARAICRWGASIVAAVRRPPLSVGLTDQTLSCAAKARVPKPTRRTACTHVSRAMQAARRRQFLT